MAMNGNTCGSAIWAALEAAGEATTPEQAWQIACTEIFAHIKANAKVTTPVLAGQVTSGLGVGGDVTTQANLVGTINQ